MRISLDSLKEGQSAKVEAILLDEKKQAKVSHLGLVKNAYIQKKYSSMMGNPVAYQIYGTVFALRNEDAKHIEVEL